MRLVKDAHEHRADAPRGDDLVGGAPAGDGARRGPAGSSTRSRPSSRTSSCAAARRRSRIRRSSPAAPTPACCTTATTTAQLQDGELLLIDAGCEYQGYASDITRTFPVNGRFTGPQKDVYELVLAAQHGVHRRGAAGRRVPRLPQGRRARARAGVTSTSACARARSTRCWRPAATSSSTCTAPATGSAWTCTTPASTRCKGASQKLAPGHGAHRRARHLHPPRRQRARGSSGTSACGSRTTCSSPPRAART